MASDIDPSKPIEGSPQTANVRANFLAAKNEIEALQAAGGGDMTSAVYDPAGIVEQLVGLVAAQTLTNKTLTAPTINGIVGGTTTSMTITTMTGNVTGNCSGTAATVTGATQAAITTAANLVTVGALNSGSITSGFGSIDVGASSITTTGTISGTLGATSVLADGVTATTQSAADNSTKVATTAYADAAAAGGGATTALDNLASVALNIALLPDAAAADDFGSATLPFKDYWFAGSSGTPGTNNFKITGSSSSGTRVITFPDASGTVIYNVVEDTTPQLGGFLDVNGNYIQTEKGGDIASASPLVIDTDGDYFDVTGTTSFAAMTVAADRQFTLQFDGALTMTHHATNLDLPGEANITTAAGDVAVFQSTGANTVQCISYTKADGTAVVGSGGASDFLLYEDQETSGTAGTTYVFGAWRTVTLDTEVADAGGHGSIASNAITLAAGTYEIIAAFVGGPGPLSSFRLRWRNTSDSSTVGQSINAETNTGPSSTAVLNNQFVIAASKVFELQIYPATANLELNSQVTTGDVEVYAQVFLKKVA